MPKSNRKYPNGGHPTHNPLNRDERRHPDLAALRTELPPFVARNFPRLKELTGYSGRYLANLDALKPPQGPPKRILLGNTTAYERESFIAWLENRSQVIS